MHSDDPVVARFIGMISASLVIFGGLVLFFISRGWTANVSPAWATIWLTLGVAGLLFHAAYDSDIQFRRLYMGTGMLLIVLGAFLSVLPYPEKVGDLFGLGVVCLALGLVFTLAFLRHEDDQQLRDIGSYALGGVGVLCALVGLFGANLNQSFIVPFGAVLPLIGLGYLASFIGSRGASDDLAYYGGIGLGLLGVLVFVVALIRSAYPPLAFGLGITSAPPGEYHVRAGLLLMVYGLLYAFVAALLVSDRTLIVLTRRELGAMFYSPIAYFIFLGFTIAHWLAYVMYFNHLARVRTAPEPIIQGFILQWPPILCILFVVPALTMRLISEEKRSGTLEILFTTPVNESGLVFSKFLAGLIMFILIWVPFGLFLLSLRIMGGTPFDYYPLLSFFIGLVITGAAFISIGILFSSLTSNQITAAVLTFSTLLTLTLVFLLKMNLYPPGEEAQSGWAIVLKHISYIDIWFDTLEGKLILKFLVFPVSVCIFCLFLTVKVLEARKWR